MFWSELVLAQKVIFSLASQLIPGLPLSTKFAEVVETTSRWEAYLEEVEVLSLNLKLGIWSWR